MWLLVLFGALLYAMGWLFVMSMAFALAVVVVITQLLGLLARGVWSLIAGETRRRRSARPIP
jgi:hypothetical protein